MRVLLDTCVVIDALQSREPFYEEAQEIFLAAGNAADPKHAVESV